MKMERSIRTGGRLCRILLSDEPQALLEAYASGRAAVGVEAGGDPWRFKGIPYVIPEFKDGEDWLLERILRRHLGLPWLIASTDRLLIRELVPSDALRITEPVDPVFSDPARLTDYIKNQYGFYEYGIWALIRREDGALAGLGGLKNPQLPEIFQKSLTSEKTWLELGYHIFTPWRRRGYASEAAQAICAYSHEELSACTCALIRAENNASRQVAEGIGMKLMRPEGQKELAADSEHLLYGRCC